MIKTVCDSVNHTRFPKEDHLPDWAWRDKNVTKDDRADSVKLAVIKLLVDIQSLWMLSGSLTFWRRIYFFFNFSTPCI